jgi:hypothetical protein
MDWKPPYQFIGRMNSTYLEYMCVYIYIDSINVVANTMWYNHKQIPILSEMGFVKQHQKSGLYRCKSSLKVVLVLMRTHHPVPAATL